MPDNIDNGPLDRAFGGEIRRDRTKLTPRMIEILAVEVAECLYPPNMTSDASIAGRAQLVRRLVRFAEEIKLSTTEGDFR